MRIRRLLIGFFTLLAAPATLLAQALPRTEHVVIGETRQTIEGWGTSLATWDDASRYSDPRWLALWQDLGLNVLRISMSKSVLQHPSGRLDRPVPISAELDENIERMNFDIPAVRLFAQHARWLRDNAAEPERVLVVGSLWSPPHWMKGPTGSSQTWLGATPAQPTPWLSGAQVEGVGDGRGDSIGGRLRTEDPDILRDYGRYVAAWVAGFEQSSGVPLHAISIQNESLFENPFDSMVVNIGPDGEEDPGQYALLLDSVRSAWYEYGIRTHIKGPHPAHIGPSPSSPWSLSATERLIEAVRAFDNGELLGFLDYFNSNYYMPASEAGAQTTAAFLRGRSAVDADWARWTFAPGVIQYAKPVWISEAGGEQMRWRPQPGDDMQNGAETVAVKMFNALVHADAVTYLYWLITDGAAQSGENTLLGIDQLDDPTQSAKYAAYRHFSRFVRPGAQRLDATFDNGFATIHGASQYDALNGLSIAAFRHEADRRFTLVGLNMTAEQRRISVDVPTDFAAGEASGWISTATRRFSPVTIEHDAGEIVFELEPSSIVTVVVTPVSAGAGQAALAQ